MIATRLAPTTWKPAVWAATSLRHASHTAVANTSPSSMATIPVKRRTLLWPLWLPSTRPTSTTASVVTVYQSPMRHWAPIIRLGTLTFAWLGGPAMLAYSGTLLAYRAHPIPNAPAPATADVSSMSLAGMRWDEWAVQCRHAWDNIVCWLGIDAFLPSPAHGVASDVASLDTATLLGYTAAVSLTSVVLYASAYYMTRDYVTRMAIELPVDSTVADASSATATALTPPPPNLRTLLEPVPALLTRPPTSSATDSPASPSPTRLHIMTARDMGPSEGSVDRLLDHFYLHARLHMHTTVWWGGEHCWRVPVRELVKIQGGLRPQDAWMANLRWRKLCESSQRPLDRFFYVELEDVRSRYPRLWFALHSCIPWSD